MRLRKSSESLRRLQVKLKRSGHAPGDSYWTAMHREFFDRVRFDKRIAKGEI